MSAGNKGSITVLSQLSLAEIPSTSTSTASNSEMSENAPSAPQTSTTNSTSTSSVSALINPGNMLRTENSIQLPVIPVKLEIYMQHNGGPCLYSGVHCIQLRSSKFLEELSSISRILPSSCIFHCQTLHEPFYSNWNHYVFSFWKTQLCKVGRIWYKTKKREILWRISRIHQMACDDNISDLM